MPYRKPLAVTIAVILGLPQIFAQTPEPPSTPPTSPADTTSAANAADTGTGEAVVITGSNIKRTDYEGPQTVKVIDRDAIDRSGVRTISQLIQKLPENTAGFTENVNNGLSFSPGAAAASLRGLGVSATLVLINGRRVTPFGLPQEGTDSFVDLNSIPISAVERVEILKEGASAIYGSDAIAGVINVILRENYSGAEVESSYGNTTRKDSSEYRESFASGFQNEKFHLLLTGNYYHRDGIADSDRSFSVDADKRGLGGTNLRSSFGSPGTVFTSTGTFAIPAGRGRNLAPTDFSGGVLDDGSFRNRYNFNKNSDLTPETERWGSLLTFGYNLTPHLELFSEASYQSVKTKTRVAPTPIDAIVPATNPFNPFGEDVEVIYRSGETGERRDRTDSDAYRFVGGLKIKDLPFNWSGEASYLYSENDVVDHLYDGYLSQAKLDRALADTDRGTSLNVFTDGRDGSNNRKTLDNLGIRPHISGVSYIHDAQLKGSGELFKLPAGPVSMAIGGEFRHEFLSQAFSEPIDAVIGTGGAGSSGSRDVYSVFVEGSIPIFSKKQKIPFLQELELTVAERYDHYSDFGKSTKPKFGFKYKPFDGLLFRGAYAEGFRAPSLPQLFSGQVNSFDTVTNPRTGESGDVPITTGGDPNLKPENSYSYFLGTIIEPPFIKGLSIEVDYYHIEQRNLIEQPATQDVVDGRAPGLVTYDGNNQITQVQELFTNLGKAVVEGIDVELNYVLPTKIGTFTLGTSVAYINSYKQSLGAGLPLQSFEDSYSLPEFKMINSLFYKNGGFEAGVSVNYVDSYDDLRGNDKHAQRTVGSWTTVDLQASYEFIYDSDSADPVADKDGKAMTTTAASVKGWRALLNHMKFTVGCNNVGDAQPPFSNVEEGYDTSTSDPTGRFIYASLRKRFW